jgi:hypothetical protein
MTDMSIEDWRLVKDHPDYRIGTSGTLQSRKRGSWKDMKTSPDGGGYLQAFMSENGVRYVRKVHKLMQDAFFEPDPERTEINHINGNKQDNRLCNLEQCSRLENMRHACDTGLFTRPEDAGRPKAKVRIRETGQIFESESDCARAIGGHVSNVCNCLAGRRHTCKGYHFDYV